MSDPSREGASRREFLRAVAAGGAALTMGAAAGADRAADERPNIILFITDDQDKESIGAYGGDALTPNLDRMAREGMVFDQAYVSSTVCTPARYSFLTGRYAGRSYSGRYVEECPPGQQGFPSFNMELEDDNMNVGAVLQKAGYVTGYVGKYHVGPDIKRPDEHEEFGLKYVSTEASADAEATAAFRDNERRYRGFLEKKGFSWAKHIYWGNLQKPFNHHNADWTNEAALEFIEANKDRPFYLHYCTTLLHGPDKSWSASLDNPNVSGAGMLDEPARWGTDREALLQRLKEEGLDRDAGHAGYTWVDDTVGAVMRKLEELGIADNTLFVFITDHGSDMKASLYSANGTNVPCILRWPKGIKAGARCEELIQNIDFAPTFFDLAGAQAPDEYIVDGRSLRPLLGGERPRKWRDRLYFEMGMGRAVCTKDWKYIAVRYTREQIQEIKGSRPDDLPKRMAYISRLGIGVRGARNPHFFDYDQLYHVAQDPGEQENLASDPRHRERLETMREMLKADLESFGRPFGEFVPGGNAAPPGLIDEQIELVKTMRIEGKKVIVPEGGATGQGEAAGGRRREGRGRVGETR